MDNQNTNNNPTLTQPNTQAPTVQPTLTHDYGAELLAELRGLRAAVESNRTATVDGFDRLADELTAAELESDRLEAPEAILVTPAATDRETGRNGERSTSATRRRESNSSDDVESDRHGIPKKRRGESRSEYLDRLESLPPVGPEKILGIFEKPDIFRARRHDGTANE